MLFCKYYIWLSVCFKLLCVLCFHSWKIFYPANCCVGTISCYIYLYIYIYIYIYIANIGTILSHGLIIWRCISIPVSCSAPYHSSPYVTQVSQITSSSDWTTLAKQRRNNCGIHRSIWPLNYKKSSNINNSRTE
jgi:hypothetical protein